MKEEIVYKILFFSLLVYCCLFYASLFLIDNSGSNFLYNFNGGWCEGVFMPGLIVSFLPVLISSIYMKNTDEYMPYWRCSVYGVLCWLFLAIGIWIPIFCGMLLTIPFLICYGLYEMYCKICKFIFK